MTSLDKNPKLSKLIKDKNKAHNHALAFFIIGGFIFVISLIPMLLFASEISKFSKLQDICDASRLTGFTTNIVRENCEQVSDTLSTSYTGLVVFAIPLTAGFLLIIGGILDYRKYQKLNRKLEEQQEKEEEKEKYEEQNNNQIEPVKEQEEKKEEEQNNKEESKKRKRDYFSASAFVPKYYE